MNKKEMEDTIKKLELNQAHLVEEIDKLRKQVEGFTDRFIKVVEMHPHYHYYYYPPDMVKPTGPQWVPPAQPTTGDLLPRKDTDGA